MRRKSDETKLKEGLGTGEGKDYRGFRRVGEFGSTGTACCTYSWRFERSYHLDSYGENMFLYLMSWNDDVLDIKEQYPLPLKETMRIAEEIGVNHPKDFRTKNPVIMTTDFLVYRNDGIHAYSVKYSPEKLSKSQKKNSLIEKEYWNSQNISWQIIYRTDMNRVMFNNIKTVTEFYRIDSVNAADGINVVKHLIANRIIKPNIETNLLDLKEIYNSNRELVDKWQRKLMKGQ